MNNLEYFIKKHSSTILSIVSGIGVITTTILAVKATPKAVKLIEEAKKDEEDLTPLEMVKVAWKPYIPTGISALSTITCIFCNGYINSKIQTSLISAYGVLNESYKNYVKTTEELFGEDAKKIKENFVKKKVDPSYKFQNGDNQLFFDYHAMRYFECPMNIVLEAEDKLNQEFAATGHCSVNDFYRFLGIATLPYGDRLGWSDNGHYQKEISFDHEIVTLDDGLQLYVLMMDEPVIDYYRY